MEALGVKTIARAAREAARRADRPSAASGLVVDGYLIPEDESLTFKDGKQNAVDVLTGSNKDEANFGICGPGAGMAGRGGAGDDRSTRSRARAERKFGELAERT